jgi:hypothetical protein
MAVMSFFIAVSLASSQPNFDLKSLTCEQVRQFVDANGGPENAEAIAREHKAPRWFINWAKRCLKT